MPVSPFHKIYNFTKKLAQLFSCELYEFFLKIFLTKHLQITASGKLNPVRAILNLVFFLNMDPVEINWLAGRFKLFMKGWTLFQIQKQPPDVSYTKAVLKNSANVSGNHLCRSLFFNKVADLKPTQMFSREVFKIFKITFFAEHLRATEAVVRMCSIKKVFLKISQNSQENTCAKVSF